MVNYGYIQFADRIMVYHRSEMSAEWKARFAISNASVAIQAFTNHTLVGRILNEFGHHTIFKNIFDCAI
jgi:hypothetical protein